MDAEAQAERVDAVGERLETEAAGGSAAWAASKKASVGSKCAKSRMPGIFARGAKPRGFRYCDG
jgi:hypothetical protein